MEWIIAYLCIGIGLAVGMYTKTSAIEKPAFTGTITTILLWPVAAVMLGMIAFLNATWTRR